MIFDEIINLPPRLENIMKHPRFFEDFKKQFSVFGNFQDKFLAKSLDSSPTNKNYHVKGTEIITLSSKVDERESPENDQLVYTKWKKEREVAKHTFDIQNARISSKKKTTVFHKRKKEATKFCSKNQDSVFLFVNKFLSKLRSYSSFRPLEKNEEIDYSLLNDKANYLNEQIANENKKINLF